MTEPLPAGPRVAWRPVPFLLALVCFLLPFVEVSCQGQRVARFTGAELALGTKVEQRDPWTGQVKTRKIDAEPFATIAAATLLLAAALAWKDQTELAMVSGSAALAALLALMTILDREAAKEASGLLRLSYLPAFWLAMLLAALLLAAAWRWRAPIAKK